MHNLPVCDIFPKLLMKLFFCENVLYMVVKDSVNIAKAQLCQQ